MSCPKSNSPIDINMQNISGNCDLKCAYNFKYPISSCNATNRGNYLSLSYDSSSNPPVMYNTIPYSVSEIRIYNPSLHSFMKKKTAGEIIIVHNSPKGGNSLLVCIPIIEGTSDTKASACLTTIIDSMSTTNNGDSETILINDFTLNDFVPKTPFFSYTAIQPYQPCIGNADIIVFGIVNSPCKLTSAILTKLKSINTSNTYTIKKGPLLFYNQKGPGSSTGNDEIFIDCKPTGTSDEFTTVTKQLSTEPLFDLETFVKTPAFQFGFCFILIIIIIYILKICINIGTNAIAGKSINLNNLNPFKTKVE
jgi:hypothetical protein